MNRLTDNDFCFGPLTFARTSWSPWRFVWSSGGSEDEDGFRNFVVLYAMGCVLRMTLPNMLRPFRVRHTANWDAATVARLGRDWWEETYPREYGFSLHEGFLRVFFGPQTGDSSTTRDWCKFLPWTQWRHVRFSLYTPDGEHFWTEQGKGSLLGTSSKIDARKECRKAVFLMEDFDGASVTATCQIEEREWRFGEGCFSWLSLFRRRRIVRSLDIEFSAEVGPEKGSWKGGTVGHGIEMLFGETPQDAFRRYCKKDHRSRSGNYRVEYLGAAE